MSSVINTNVKSLVAQQAMTVNNRALSQAMQQLSTGKRINSAADDAAGLAIADKMTAQVKGLNMAVRNANDAISMLQTVEGATVEVTNMLQRMREVAVQAANGTNATADATALSTEYNQLSAEITRIGNNTTWNGFTVIDSSATSYVFQVGANTSQTITAIFSTVVSMAGVTSALAITTANDSSAITALDAAIASVDTFRAGLGAKINRLNYAADNLAQTATNQAASRSRVLDTDYAKATTELARSQIIQQASTAMLAQANQEPSQILSLLK